jgi:hypothetical protein
MFTADYIYERIQDRPFVPLRIATSSGESYDVYHPELVVCQRAILICRQGQFQKPENVRWCIARSTIAHYGS